MDPSQITDSAAPNPQAIVVQRLRLRYAKRGRLRFTSHRDFARAFERAVRRAGLPIGHSSGYSPHPKISYSNASPTGAGREAEFLEIGLTETRDIVDVAIAGPGSLNDRLQASRWTITIPDAPAATVQQAATRFLAATEIPVERMTKRGLKTFDARSAVVSMQVRGGEAPDEGCAILDVVIRHDVAPGGL